MDSRLLTNQLTHVSCVPSCFELFAVIGEIEQFSIERRNQTNYSPITLLSHSQTVVKPLPKPDYLRDSLENCPNHLTEAPKLNSY